MDNASQPERKLIHDFDELHSHAEQALREAQVLCVRRRNEGLSPSYYRDGERLDRLMDSLEERRQKLDARAEVIGVPIEDLSLPNCQCV